MYKGGAVKAVVSGKVTREHLPYLRRGMYLEGKWNAKGGKRREMFFREGRKGGRREGM